MVKARIPGSSQELYTVSVESVPQYANGDSKRSGCCKSGRVGKDLLCGVLIALAVICAAVAIFLVVFYVVNGTDENTAPKGSEADQQNGTLDSSPLTRDREEEKKINSLKSIPEWDNSQTKDQLSLSSTSLPDVGIHEPEFHAKGQTVYPPYNTKSSTTTETIPDREKVEDSLPIVEANSQDIDDKIPSTLFVPDDDAIIETPSANPTEQKTDPAPIVVVIPESSPATTTSTTTTVQVVESTTTSIPEPSPEVDQGGFVPVVNQEEIEQVTDAQTEALPEILAVKPVDSLAVDTAPWKPIDAETAALPATNVTNVQDIQGRLIEENSAAGPQSIPKEEEKSSTTAKTLVTQSVRPVEIVKQDPEVEPIDFVQEPEESTDFALMQNLGNMALLVPEDRIRTSSVASPVNRLSSSTEQSSSTVVAPFAEPQCIRRQLPFCRGILPYSETVLPNWVGDNSESERNFSVPYFEIIAESECHPRVQQYACAVLEPPCRGNGISLPPCRQFCRAIAEDCSSYVLSALTLASVLDCDQFPQSNDPNVCLNLASTTPEGECLPNEYRCSNDNTCIPERWVCDGRQDCSQGDDEFSCNRCREEEFRCESENRCLPKRWKCDGSRDCADGSDERDCPTNQECGDGQFRCGDGLSCIPLRRVCDGSNHCRDNSDETNCTSIACQIEDFKCLDNGVCISRKWVCDGNEDCKDGSDETECAREAELDLESDVLIDEMLDGFSGNETFPSPDTTFNPDKCPLGELLCMSGSTCIRFEQLCDGTRDCADGADETDCSKSPGPE